MTVITRDLPYYNVSFFNHATGVTTSGLDTVSTTDTGTDIVLPDIASTISGGNYGVGSDFINFPTDIPSGYTLTGGCYVAIAYTESGGTIPADTSGWGYRPAPLTEPFLLNFGNGIFNIIDGLPVGGYGGEVAQRATDPHLLSDGPAGSWRIAENLFNGDPAPPIHVAYLAVRLFYENSEIDLPCDTTVDMDLSTATFLTAPDAVDDVGPFGQYSDGVIWPLPDPGGGADYLPDFTLGIVLDVAKRDRITITFDPDSVHDSGGRDFLILGIPSADTTVPTGPPVFYDGSGNTDDSVTFTIGPGRGDWDDPSIGVAAGNDGVWFETSNMGAVSAISIRKVCKTVIPWQRLTNRDELRLTGRRSTQGSARLTGYL